MEIILNKKWAKVESRYDRLFAELKDSQSENINRIEDDFFRHYIARTALTVKGMNGNIIQHSITGNLPTLIDGSIIKEMPPYCPKLLNNFYVLFRKPHKGIKALWGFYYDKQLFICGEKANKKMISAFYPMNFEKQEFSFGLEDLYDERTETNNEQGLYFVRYLLTLGLFLEAKNTPIEIKKEVLRCSPSVFGAKLNKTEYKIKIKQSFLDRQKVDKAVLVGGHWKNQAYGELWSKHEMRYIAPFERQQKVNKRNE